MRASPGAQCRWECMFFLSRGMMLVMVMMTRGLRGIFSLGPRAAAGTGSAREVCRGNAGQEDVDVGQ